MLPKQERGTFRKLITKPSEQVPAPPSTIFNESDPELDIIPCLLVEDVDGEYAECVVVLDGARGSVGVERALGHLGEDHVERVGAALLDGGQYVLK